MKTSDFYYDLPEELIAQVPLEDRTSSRLMVVDKKTGKIEHKHFYDIIDYLEEGDCLVLNDTKVIPHVLLAKEKGQAQEWNSFFLTDLILTDGKLWFIPEKRQNPVLK